MPEHSVFLGECGRCGSGSNGRWWTILPTVTSGGVPRLRARAATVGSNGPAFAAEADALGIRHIATGHYFRITSAGGKRYVTRAADNRKDQSYYLWDLPQEILDRVLTPMGTVIKRNIVEELADRRESMGVCFLGGTPVPRLPCEAGIKRKALRPGPIIDSAGHRLGTHDGAALYTIGQKKGLDLPPGWAVVAIDTAANRIVAGEEKLLLHRTLEVGECRLIESDEVFGARDIRAVIRGIGRNPEGYAAVFLPLRGFGSNWRILRGPRPPGSPSFCTEGNGSSEAESSNGIINELLNLRSGWIFQGFIPKKILRCFRIYYLCTSKTSPETAIPMRCYYNAVFAKRRVFDERDNFS